MSAPAEKKDEKKAADGEKRGGFVDNKPKKKKVDLMDVEIKKKKLEAEFGPVVDKAIPEHIALAKVRRLPCARGP